MKAYQTLGEILIAKGKITHDQLSAGLLSRQGHKRRLGDVLVTLGYVTEDDITECLGEQYDIEIVDVSKITPDPIALRILDTETALENRILPLRFIDDKIECIIADPIDVSTMDMIPQVTNKHVIFRIAPISALLDAIRRAYSLNVVDMRGIASGKRASHRNETREALTALIGFEMEWSETVPVLIET